MPKLTVLIRSTWLDSAVPVSLDDMKDFRKAIALVQVFAETIAKLGWEGSNDLQDWVESAPRLWVAKRRETSLNSTRKQLSHGIGHTKEVERTETQIITEMEGEHLAPNSQNKEADKGEHDWDAAWSDDEGKGSEGKGSEGKGSEGTSSGKLASSSIGGSSLEQESNWTAEVVKEDNATKDAAFNDDDAADAWGWGDEDDGDVAEKPVDPPTTVPKETDEAEPEGPRQVQREITLTEKYRVSSMPEPVFQAITDIIEDGVTLTREQ